MKSDDASQDHIEIRSLIERQAARLCWTPESTADWEGFRTAFLPGGTMVPAARPALPRPVDAFVERMKALSTSSLKTFHEKALGGQILIFGNVAIALAGSETLENGDEVNRDVSGYLLVKTEGRWMIVAQAWDKEKPGLPITGALAGKPEP